MAKVMRRLSPCSTGTRLMLDMTMASVVPILISSVTATSVSYFFSGSSFIFEFGAYEPFSIHRIPYLILLGVVCGLVSLYFTRGMNKIEGFYRKIKNPYSKLAVGGPVLSLLIFIFPPLYGEGYGTIVENDKLRICKCSNLS